MVVSVRPSKRSGRWGNDVERIPLEEWRTGILHTEESVCYKAKKRHDTDDRSQGFQWHSCRKGSRALRTTQMCGTCWEMEKEKSCGRRIHWSCLFFLPNENKREMQIAWREFQLFRDFVRCGNWTAREENDVSEKNVSSLAVTRSPRSWKMRRWILPEFVR